MKSKEFDTAEEIEVFSPDTDKPRGIRTLLHEFKMGIVYHAASIYDENEDGYSLFLQTLKEKTTLEQIVIQRWQHLGLDF